MSDTFEDIVKDLDTFEPLTRQDRCDRCRAAAQARVVRRNKTGKATDELMFCSHHLNLYAEPLTDQGFIVT